VAVDIDQAGFSGNLTDHVGFPDFVVHRSRSHGSSILAHGREGGRREAYGVPFTRNGSTHRAALGMTTRGKIPSLCAFFLARKLGLHWGAKAGLQVAARRSLRRGWKS
jgi:hypothetical protein